MDVRKRQVGRDPSPMESQVDTMMYTGTRASTATDNRHSNQYRNGGTSYIHTGRKKRLSRKCNKASNFISRWSMNFKKNRSPAAAIGFVIVVASSILMLLLVGAISIKLFLSALRSESCIRNQINGIDLDNVYNWCYKHTDRDNGFHSRIGRALSMTTPNTGIERVVFESDNLPSDQNHQHHPKRMMIGAIDVHERLNQETIAEDYADLCYADLARYGKTMFDPAAYHSISIGPCHYDDQLTDTPNSGSYEEVIDFYHFRDSEGSHFTDRLKCMNECIDRALMGPDRNGKHHGHVKKESEENHRKRYRQNQPSDERALDEIEPEERVPVDNIMLIEAAQQGMTFAVEKLMLKYDLDPLYRQVHDDPTNGRSLNAIQEAIRGGFAEIVAILTGGDNSMVIDEYGRTVADYVQMKGSPVRPIDAENVLGIIVDEGRFSQKNQEHPSGHHTDSGWNENSADLYDEQRCDFDILDGDVDPDVFFKDYFITGRPVVLRAQVPQIELDMFSKKRWSRNEKFNLKTKFQVGPTAYPPLTDQDYCSEEMSILDIEAAKVCEEMPEKPMVHAFHPDDYDFKELYSDFNGNVLDGRGGFRAIQHLFGTVEDEDELVWQVFFGGDKSGATFHWHEAAFNILYVGVKEWKVAPPLYKGTTGMTAQHVSSTLDPKISLTCVQQPGDLFYIPNYWGHSTLNRGFTIGAAAIVKDWYQNGATTFRGEKKTVEDEEEEGPPFLFVHINKTGGTSLISMFNERCEDEYWGGDWEDVHGEYHRAFHATAHAYIEEYGRKKWDNAYTFTVVRHPLARQVSNFFFLVEKGCSMPNNKCAERMIPSLDLLSMTDDEKIAAFHDWLSKLYIAFPPGSNDHYRFGAAGHGNEVYDTFGATQTSWLVDPDGELVVKDIYKLEELSKDISALAKNIPCLSKGPLNMAQKNKTSKYPDFLLFAKNEETKKIINEVFAEDFKNLGYDPL